MKFIQTTLITGANGFIGGELLRQLSENKNIRIRATDKIFKKETKLKNPEIEFIETDITKPSEMEKLLKDVERVFHVAGICNLTTSYEKLKPINVDAIDTITDLVILEKIKSYVHFSSSSVYGLYRGKPFSEDDQCFPSDSYGRSKYIGESIVRNKIKLGLPAIIIRPCAVYGPGCNDGAGKVFSRPGSIAGIPGNGKQKLSNVRVEDVAGSAIFLSEQEGNIGEIFNVADNSNPELEEALILTSQEFHSKLSRTHIPLKLLKIISRIEALIARMKNKIPDLEYEAIKYLYSDYIVDNKKLLNCGYVLKYPDFHLSIKKIGEIFWKRNI